MKKDILHSVSFGQRPSSDSLSRLRVQTGRKRNWPYFDKNISSRKSLHRSWKKYRTVLDTNSDAIMTHAMAIRCFAPIGRWGNLSENGRPTTKMNGNQSFDSGTRRT